MSAECTIWLLPVRQYKLVVNPVWLLAWKYTKLMLTRTQPTYLVCRNGHVHLISDSEQQQTPLCTVNGDFPDQLIKALSIQLFPDRTNACLSCLQRQRAC